jgi:hypothetical protein
MTRVEDPDVGTAVWRSNSEFLALTVHRGADGSIEVELSDLILSTKEEVTEQFINAMAETALQEAGGVEATDDGLVKPSDVEPFPYDPETIRVDTKPFNISLVFDMIEDGDINLSPDFQRRFVWTDTGARSRLIESIMLRIPLPVFYMAQDSTGRLHVVDGLQRLTVIRQFLKNELRLRELEYLKEEEGKVFRHDDPAKCINQRYRKRIMQTQVMMNIIDPQTPSDVKFDIFKRINQGGRPLNAQEIRNCMSTPSTRQLISTLANSDPFIKATQGSVGTVRMQDHELVLRFLAFRLSALGKQAEYQGNMDRFLDQAVDHLNNSSKELRRELTSQFLTSMINCRHLFGDYAFRKCLPEDLRPGARRRLINNALYTAWSTVLAPYDNAAVKRAPQASFANLLAESFRQDADLLDSVTSGTNDRRRINYVIKSAQDICSVRLV